MERSHQLQRVQHARLRVEAQADTQLKICLYGMPHASILRPAPLGRASILRLGAERVGTRKVDENRPLEQRPAPQCATAGGSGRSDSRGSTAATGVYGRCHLVHLSGNGKSGVQRALQAQV